MTSGSESMSVRPIEVRAVPLFRWVPSIDGRDVLSTKIKEKEKGKKRERVIERGI